MEVRLLTRRIVVKPVSRTVIGSSLSLEITLHTFDPRLGPSPIAEDPTKEIVPRPPELPPPPAGKHDPWYPGVYDTWRFTGTCDYAFHPIGGWPRREDCERGRKAYLDLNPTDRVTRCYRYHPFDVLVPEAARQ